MCKGYYIKLEIIEFLHQTQSDRQTKHQQQGIKNLKAFKYREPERIWRIDRQTHTQKHPKHSSALKWNPPHPFHFISSAAAALLLVHPLWSYSRSTGGTHNLMFTEKQGQRILSTTRLDFIAFHLEWCRRHPTTFTFIPHHPPQQQQPKQKQRRVNHPKTCFVLKVLQRLVLLFFR